MESKKFYWLKLKRDFFKRHDIWILDCMPNGKEIVLLYIKLLVESIDHGGRLRFNDDIPYTPEMLASLFRMTAENMDSALKIMKDLELMKIESDGTIIMTKFEDFVGSDTQSAIQKRNQRNLPKLANGSKRLNKDYVVMPNGKSHFVDEKRYGGHGMQALDRAMGKCELCGAEDSIVIHHNNGYSNELDDLVCLCISCHGKAHNNKNKGHINIDRPPYVHHMSTDCPPDVRQTSVQSIEIRDKSIEIRDKRNIKEKTPSFSRPSVEEVSAYCQERGNNVDPEAFVAFYDSKGWKVGNSPMKNWRSAVITWEKRNKPEPKKSGNEFLDLLDKWEGDDEQE